MLCCAPRTPLPRHQPANAGLGWPAAESAPGAERGQPSFRQDVGGGGSGGRLARQTRRWQRSTNCGTSTGRKSPWQASNPATWRHRVLRALASEGIARPMRER